MKKRNLGMQESQKETVGAKWVRVKVETAFVRGRVKKYGRCRFAIMNTRLRGAIV